MPQRRSPVRSHSHGIELKKKFGQHFLRNSLVLQHMIEQIDLNGASVLEIGPGDGVLTQAILEQPVARLWAFEIDPDWASFLKKTIIDGRLSIFEQNILDVDFNLFEEFQPWIVLSNLPYQVTFPILHRFQEYRYLFTQGVVMVQEEVAQKIVKKSGRGFGFSSLFFQYYFDWKLLQKVSPSSFEPPPKVDSRLLYFKTKAHVDPINDEEGFWRFIKLCFRSPRRTLRNNLMTTQLDLSHIPADVLALRAQQMTIDGLKQVWQKINHPQSSEQ